MVGSYSNMIGVLIKKGILDTDLQAESSPWKSEGRLGAVCNSQGKTKIASKPSEAQREWQGSNASHST
jgi:hypothetical protein